MSFCSSRWIKATRKPHRCGWCDEIIEAGSSSRYDTGIAEDFFACHYHPECAQAIDNLTRMELRDMDYMWFPGDHPRGRTSWESLTPIFSPDYRGTESIKP
jgi:hypothetical protein